MRVIAGGKRRGLRRTSRKRRGDGVPTNDDS
jgi:hypothetical protein